MKGTELKTLREKLDLTQESLAKRLGVKRLSVIRWETGKTAIPTTVELALKEIARQESR
jgi:transcriptional regulator with XRE-family HTH domain